MKKFRFRICSDFYNSPDIKQFSNVDILLSDINRNDYGYYSIYKMLVTPKLIKNSNSIVTNTTIGNFCIMNIEDDDRGYKALLNLAKPYGYEFLGELPETCVSMPLDVDSAKILLCGLTLEQRLELIKSMHMILGDDVFYYKAIATTIGESIFEKSFMRGTNWGIFKKKILEPFKQIITMHHNESSEYERLFLIRTTDAI